MRIWIDMDNSPHVFLLIPFIKKLEAKNYSVHVTAREYAQTIELLKSSGLNFTQIGKHGGANKLWKIINLVDRVLRLLVFAKRMHFIMGINHGSRAHSLACKILSIPCFIGMDYEHTESKIFAVCAKRIWIPNLLFPAALPSIGVDESGVIVYPGIKEQFYLRDFVPDQQFKQTHHIPLDCILVVLRPPADLANYHDEKSETIVERVVEQLIRTKGLYTICTPRTHQQKSKFKKFESPVFRVIDTALDGKNLAYYSDVMISGGGTMNREAAYFGARVYSIFSGQKPMLDLELQKIGLLTFIESIQDCTAMEFTKKTSWDSVQLAPPVNPLDELIHQFISLSNHNRI